MQLPGLEQGARHFPGRGTSGWWLRMQQVLAFETDLLEYGDIFDGSTVIEQRTTRTSATRPRPNSMTSSRWEVRSNRWRP